MSTLVISRRIGEGVKIGEDIFIRLARAKRDGAFRLVIEAPRCVKILREELVGTEAKK
jgi:carbon storage regulator CsrA